MPHATPIYSKRIQKGDALLGDMRMLVRSWADSIGAEDTQAAQQGCLPVIIITEKDLENDPKSLDGFWPGMEDISVSAEMRLANLKSDLDKIHKSWTKSLLTDLADPVIQGIFELLKKSEKKLLNDFIQAKELPDEITQEFLAALQQALSGLKRVALSTGIVKKVLFPEDVPVTLEELKAKFNGYLVDVGKGQDPRHIRVVFESGSGGASTSAGGTSKPKLIIPEGVSPDVVAFYEGRSDAQERINRNKRLVDELKALYQRSQVDGDVLPAFLQLDIALSALEVHHIIPLAEGGDDERHNMIVTTATMHNLIHAAAKQNKCDVTLTMKCMTFHGKNVPVHVDLNHNGDQ
jgi:hypothetical protein